MFPARPAIYLETAMRSTLLALGLDPIFTEFLIRTAIGAATVLAMILFAALRTPKRRGGNVPNRNRRAGLLL